MSYNLKTYLSQVALYINLLAALYMAGCSMIQFQISQGIRVIITRHFTLFHDELGWLTEDVVELNRQKESLENENRDLKQDNNSLKALRDVETERWTNVHRQDVLAWIKATHQQRADKATTVEETPAKASELSHEVSILKAEKHELEREVTETKKDREITITQLHTARIQNEQLKQETWKLQDEVDGAWKEAQRKATRQRDIERLIIRTGFLIDIAIARGFCDFRTVSSTLEMKRWLKSSRVFREIMSDWRAIHGEEFFSDEEEEVVAKYNLI